jgi:small glutamine-rich tetratricopeptide repeat-containing protein alpha
MKQALATAKARVSESSSNTVADREPAPRAGGGGGGGGMPDLASLASMMGGMGGGGGGGGMPDLASLMQNPQMMQMYVLFFSSQQSILLLSPLLSLFISSEQYKRSKLIYRAQQMMQNGGLDRMMQNPNIRQMAEQMQNGGGMPDFSQLAQDPAMRDM